MQKYLVYASIKIEDKIKKNDVVFSQPDERDSFICWFEIALLVSYIDYIKDIASTVWTDFNNFYIAFAQVSIITSAYLYISIYLLMFELLFEKLKHRSMGSGRDFSPISKSNFLHHVISA